MTADPLYRFPARMDSLGPMLARLRSASGGVEPAAVLRAETAIEELLTNSVIHGGSVGDGLASVWLSAQASGNVLQLRYEDAGVAFDPMPTINTALQRTSSPMDQRPLGGLGLLMVYRLADKFQYVRANGRNCVALSFAGAGAR